jgi:hypothetical protein
VGPECESWDRRGRGWRSRGHRDTTTPS